MCRWMDGWMDGYIDVDITFILLPFYCITFFSRGKEGERKKVGRDGGRRKGYISSFLHSCIHLSTYLFIHPSIYHPLFRFSTAESSAVSFHLISSHLVSVSFPFLIKNEIEIGNWAFVGRKAGCGWRGFMGCCAVLCCANTIGIRWNQSRRSYRVLGWLVTLDVHLGVLYIYYSTGLPSTSALSSFLSSARAEMILFTYLLTLRTIS